MNDFAEESAVPVATKPKGKPGRKPRERSAAGLSVDESIRAGLTLEDTRDPNASVLAERVRVPLGAGQNQWLRGYQLDWDKYHYHLFHETATRGGRVAEADQAFYEHCQINGENIKRPAGNGWDYLMRIPRKYYLEDVAASRKKREAIEKAQNTLKSGDKIQEYGINPRTGRPIFDGEAVAKQSESDNPYA